MGISGLAEERVDPSSHHAVDYLEDGADALDCVRTSILGQASMFDFSEASAFAGRVEDIARIVEYLQIVAAHAVERTRNEAGKALGSSSTRVAWRTGWTEKTDPASGKQADPAKEAGSAAVLDDGYRNAADFLRSRLRITAKEARRRLALAGTVLPGIGIAGEPIPPQREQLASAVADALISTGSATLISTALDRVQLLTDEDTITRMEKALTATAIRSDPDFVSTTARHWADLIDQDGPEPTEEVLRHLQGAFIRKPRHGLHHLEIFATAEQFETLTTVMNAATNPRLVDGDARNNGRPSGSGEAALDGKITDTLGRTPTIVTQRVPELERRSRAQRLLDGLVGGCALALRTAQLPANGGLKPQVMVTIDHRDLFDQLQNQAAQNQTANPVGTVNAGPGTKSTNDGAKGIGGSRTRLSSAVSTFQGPIHPNVIRKIACDADILPVLLGTEGQVLGIGRTSRIFPPHIRKALNARDQGCAFPDCTMPAPWCEAHHITYWSQGGPTNTDNGVLLCSHHHHVIHKEQWKIASRNGVPWFTPPPHIDPGQTARRNHHHTPLRT
ncbi:HNH endonuclease signature motif containing protein [Paenarthrobacter histidinolovorans]|uniref:HNH endonuclease signature motif containing protein n=1 Tax=Paenarthrobacter histidinolovorans TaxID=43664 RepID=UPI00199300DB|nr:HNH endonuclease signature motif containing protein [Paenarthrobacter histidinolovorans]GGJ32567.1 HNH endonuclease [Paenarthrobacter histidinolovorans]